MEGSGSVLIQIRLWHLLIAVISLTLSIGGGVLALGYWIGQLVEKIEYIATTLERHSGQIAELYQGKVGKDACKDWRDTYEQAG